MKKGKVIVTKLAPELTTNWCIKRKVALNFKELRLILRSTLNRLLAQGGPDLLKGIYCTGKAKKPSKCNC